MGHAAVYLSREEGPGAMCFDPESMAARLATERASATEIGSLRSLLASFDQAEIRYHIDEYSEANITFHRRILEMSQCRIVMDMADGLFIHMRAIRARHFLDAAHALDLRYVDAGPGGVEAEQMKSRGFGVAYGSRRATGRVKSWNASATPPVIAPPLSFGLVRSKSPGPMAWRARMRSRKPGAKRSIWASTRSTPRSACTSQSTPVGTWVYAQPVWWPAGARLGSARLCWPNRTNGRSETTPASSSRRHCSSSCGPPPTCTVPADLAGSAVHGTTPSSAQSTLKVPLPNSNRRIAARARAAFERRLALTEGALLRGLPRGSR